MFGPRWWCAAWLSLLLVDCREETPVEAPVAHRRPPRITEVASVAASDPSAYFVDLVVEGWYAYAVTGPEASESTPWSGLYVYNVCAPATPWLVSFSSVGHPTSVAVDRGFAFVGTRAGVHIFDVREPDHAHRASSFGQAVISDLGIRANTLYCASLGGAVEVVDIGDPAHPAAVASIPSGLSSVKGMALSERYLSLTGAPNTLALFDVTSEDAPALIARFEGAPMEVLDLWDDWPGVPYGLRYDRPVVDGTSLIVTALGGYAVYDIASPTPREQLIASIHPVPNLLVADGEWLIRDAPGTQGPGAHTPDRGWALVIYDRTNPRMPIAAGRIPLQGPATSIRKSGEYVYVTGVRQGLKVFRL